MTKHPCRLLSGSKHAFAGLAVQLFLCGAFLFASVAPATAQPLGGLVVNLDGDSSVFLPGGTPQFLDADPQDDGMGLAIVDGDPAASFAGGHLAITQTGGTTDGSISFFSPTVRAGANGRLGGETVATANSRWVAIGVIAAAADGQQGQALRIDFGAGATALSIEDILLSLMYSAPTGGQRQFAVMLDDGHGRTAGPLLIIMDGG